MKKYLLKTLIPILILVLSNLSGVFAQNNYIGIDLGSVSTRFLYQNDNNFEQTITGNGLNFGFLYGHEFLDGKLGLETGFYNSTTGCQIPQYSKVNNTLSLNGTFKNSSMNNSIIPLRVFSYFYPLKNTFFLKPSLGMAMYIPNSGNSTGSSWVETAEVTSAVNFERERNIKLAGEAGIALGLRFNVGEIYFRSAYRQRSGTPLNGVQLTTYYADGSEVNGTIAPLSHLSFSVGVNTWFGKKQIPDKYPDGSEMQ